MRQEGSGGSVTLDISDREGILRLREALDTAKYDVSHIRPMLRADSDSLTPRPADIPIIVRLLPKDERLASLLRLFVLGLAVPQAEARTALAPLSVERALRLGVVQRCTGGVESTVRILPAGDVLIACDRSPEGSADLPADHVMGVASSSILLASLTVRRHVARALDIGCGGGIQSVLAARHADRVIACDINPRALNFTAFNALLNGVDNVECRLGSFFAPVQGETFDLIVSNPPFVISPESALVFRDSGLRGDDVSRKVIRQASEYLRESGLAFMLMSWGVAKGAAWPDRLRPWVADLPCDIWFLHHSSEAPLLYAASWNSPLQSRPRLGRVRRDDPAKAERGDKLGAVRRSARPARASVWPADRGVDRRAGLSRRAQERARSPRRPPRAFTDAPTRSGAAQPWQWLRGRDRSPQA